MAKFAKGMVMGALIGVAFEMVMMPKMDRKTRKSMKKAAKKMRHMADSTCEGIHDWIS